MSKLTHEKALIVFEEYLISCGFKEVVIKLKIRESGLFLTFTGKEDVREIVREDLVKYMEYVNEQVSSRTGRALAKKTRHRMWSVVKQLFRSLYLAEKVIMNPARELKFRACGREKQREILTREEMAGLLDCIETNEFLGLRDRAVFELFYSTGMRSGELVSLKVGDINFNQSLVWIRNGKWGKDRVVPVSEVAMVFLKKYLGRRISARGEWLFVGTLKNRKLEASHLNIHLRKYLARTNLKGRHITCHSIRHSVATHLLENGADMRYVQELLGHESIETTEVYTHALEESIKKAYKRAHPRENEHFKEVDGAYLERIERFIRRLKKQKHVREVRIKREKKLFKG